MTYKEYNREIKLESILECPSEKYAILKKHLNEIIDVTQCKAYDKDMFYYFRGEHCQFYSDGNFLGIREGILTNMYTLFGITIEESLKILGYLINKKFNKKCYHFSRIPNKIVGKYIDPKYHNNELSIIT